MYSDLGVTKTTRRAGGPTWAGQFPVDCAPITLDAFKMPITGQTQVWTGADGNAQPTAENCNGWTTNAAGATGGAGTFGGTGKEWTQAAQLRECGQSAPLLCDACHTSTDRKQRGQCAPAKFFSKKRSSVSWKGFISGGHSAACSLRHRSIERTCTHSNESDDSSSQRTC